MHLAGGTHQACDALSCVVHVLQGLRLEMGAALAAGHADLEGREAAVKDAERRLAVQQVGSKTCSISPCICTVAVAC
jgi:hypothetical protein